MTVSPRDCPCYRARNGTARSLDSSLGAEIASGRITNLNKTFAFIIEATAVARLERKLALRSDPPPEEQFEYLLRRAQLLAVMAEDTGDEEDRTLAEKAWGLVRAAQEKNSAVDVHFEESWAKLLRRKYGNWKPNTGLDIPC